jgi:hypothetical protein
MQHFNRSRAGALASLVAALTASCSGTFSSPTPTVTSVTTSSTPAPGPSSFAIKGRVTETPPTPNTGIAAARVTISVGPKAGMSVTTDLYGFFSLDSVDSGSTLNVSAPGYLSSLRTVDGDSSSTFPLMPVPKTETHSMEGTLASDGGTCSDGVSEKPCQIMAIPIHNQGPIEATLTWTPADSANLDVTLFQTGTAAPIARSAAPGSTPEHISATLPAGVTYELRVTYASGTGPVNYVLRVTHLN